MLERGEIWTMSGGKDYASKPRLVVIIQDDRFDSSDSLTICPFSTDTTDLPMFRLVVEADAENGLRAKSCLMADQVNTVPKTKIGYRVGRLDDETLHRLSRAIIVYLSLAASPRVRAAG
jgi:mRNA interferase MazF